MTARNVASETQVQAATPDRSTWLAANAGSGKTRVLTDRVARLLLAETEPQKVLCLTYTKAAASEMQNRLLARLGGWAMLPDAPLRAALADLGHRGAITDATLAQARRLFAKAIETPGGLKIQTIHAFCAALLRRFPLEAGVSHDFTELDERAGAMLRADVVEELAAGADVAAVDALARYFPGEGLDALLAEISANSAAFACPADRAAALALFDLPAAFSPQVLLDAIFAPGTAAAIAALVPMLLASSSSDAKAGAKLAALNLAAPDMESCTVLEEVFLYGKGAKVSTPFSAKTDSFPTKALRNGAAAPLMPALQALALRLQDGRPRRLALAAAEKALALQRFGHAWLARYSAHKAARGWLDFDDLIQRAVALLHDPSVAQWVLFRLDGGIDHILVDEAQDTSPGQWQVIASLAAEFTAGKGARDAARTLFVVGDRKQSIYSFQGADLREYERMRTEFAARFDAAGRPLQAMGLAHSFRSSAAILRLIDLTFGDAAQNGLGGPTTHIAHHRDLPGRVDLWPPVPKPEKEPETDWRDPLGLRGPQDETVVLARAVAAQIRQLIERGTQLPAQGGARPVHEGDFLILVQRRGALFAELIRACKAEGLAIAGADRLKLGAELAVRDIAAVLAFLATPEDDLSLAAALRSPLFGWTEAQLFALAQPRSGYLWEALRHDPDHGATLALLQDLRDQADFLRPYDIIERLLTRHRGRERLIGRLGPEAEDGIDELLSQALAFERAEVPSLTGFLGWLSADDIDVKRAAGGTGRAIRVMTVHGAKGLESPIVILPDTKVRQNRLRREVVLLRGGAVWKTADDEAPPQLAEAQAALRQRQHEERLRLLYVAMTRAEKWLIVCAAGDVGTGDESWYALVREALQKAGAEPDFTVTALAGPVGNITRLGCGDWPADAPGAAARPLSPAPLPQWALQTPGPEPATAATLSPSDLGGAKALPGEAGLLEDAAKRRGRRLHRLLQHLPEWPRESWRELAETLLGQGDDAADWAETKPVFTEAMQVLMAPALAPYFVPGALAEVEFTARLPALGNRVVHGSIDRLVVRDGVLRVLDYKSNAQAPRHPEDVPEGILRQLGAYAAALAQIYPGHRVETAIYWTAAARLMPLPAALIAAALDRVAHLDVAPSRS